jgi:dTDP-4-amino-4,6-dideoxygalactose transaminase
MMLEIMYMTRFAYEDIAKLNQFWLGDYFTHIEKVLQNDSLILGRAVTEFEESFSEKLGLNDFRKGTVSVGSGYDALFIIFRHLKKKLPNSSKVFLQSNSYFATVAAAINAGFGII